MSSTVSMNWYPLVDIESRHPSLRDYKPMPPTGLTTAEWAALVAAGADEVVSDDEYAGDDEYETDGDDDESVGTGEGDDEDNSHSIYSVSCLSPSQYTDDEAISSFSLSPAVWPIASPAPQPISNATLGGTHMCFYTPPAAVQLQMSSLAVVSTLPSLTPLLPATFTDDTGSLESDDSNDDNTESASSNVVLTPSDDDLFWVDAFAKELSIVGLDIFEE